MSSDAYTPPEGRFDRLYGLERVELRDGVVTAAVPVADRVLQPFGLVHGGVYASIAEALASIGTAAVVVPQGNAAMGSSNSTTFLRPIIAGTIHARAQPRHRGRTTWVWDVEISDDDGRACALSRVTIAVRPLPAGAGAQPR